MNMQTTTSVHSPLDHARMLIKNTQRETSAALAVNLYAQLLCMSALRLLSIASTASWISLLLIVPAAVGAYFLSAFAVKKKSCPRGVLAGFALLFWMDMAVQLFALTELVCAYVLPQAPRSAVVLFAAFSVTLLMGGRAHGGAARAAYLLRGFFLLAVIVCFLFSVRESNTGFLYPILGYGAGQTARGAVYMLGGVWSIAALPVIAHNKGDGVRKNLHTAVHPLLSLLLLTLLLFSYACLLPSPLLPGDWGFVLRLQLLMEMSPNTLAWSLMLISRMLLFLTAFSVSGDFARLLLCHAFKKRRVPLWPMALCCVPVSILGVARVESVLSNLLTLRFPLAVILVLTLLLKKEVA